MPTSTIFFSSLHFFILLLTISSSLLPALSELTPKIVAGLTKELAQKSAKTRVGAFALLRELVNAHPGVLSNHVKALIPGITFSLGVFYYYFPLCYKNSWLIWSIGQGNQFQLEDRGTHLLAPPFVYPPRHCFPRSHPNPCPSCIHISHTHIYK